MKKATPRCWQTGRKVSAARVMAVRGLEIEVRRESWDEPGAGAR